jgi:hypothetical protein
MIALQRTLFLTLLCYLAVWPTVFGVMYVANPDIRAVPALTAIVRDATAVLAALLVFLGTSMRKRIKTYTEPMPIWIIACLFCALVAIVYSTRMTATVPSFAIAKLVIYGTCVLAGFSLRLWLRTLDDGAMDMLFLSIVLSALLYVGFVATVLQAYVATIGTENWAISFFPFMNVRIFSNYLAPCIAIATGLACSDRLSGTRLQVFVVIVLCILWATLCWSGGRAPVLALVFATSLALVWLDPTRRKRLLWIAAGTAIVGLVISLGIDRPNGSFGITDRLVATTHDTTLAQVTSLRSMLWAEVWRGFLDHPIFGNGYVQFRFHEATVPGDHNLAHCFVLDVLYDLGLVGGGALIVLAFGSFGRRCLQTWRSLPAAGIAPFMAIATILSQSFLDATLYQSHTLFLIALCYSALAVFIERRDLRRAETAEKPDSASLVAGY